MIDNTQGQVGAISESGGRGLNTQGQFYLQIRDLYVLQTRKSGDRSVSCGKLKN